MCTPVQKSDSKETVCKNERSCRFSESELEAHGSLDTRDAMTAGNFTGTLVLQTSAPKNEK